MERSKSREISRHEWTGVIFITSLICSLVFAVYVMFSTGSIGNGLLSIVGSLLMFAFFPGSLVCILYGIAHGIWQFDNPFE